MCNVQLNNNSGFRYNWCENCLNPAIHAIWKWWKNSMTYTWQNTSCCPLKFQFTPTKTFAHNCRKKVHTKLASWKVKSVHVVSYFHGNQISMLSKAISSPILNGARASNVLVVSVGLKRDIQTNPQRKLKHTFFQSDCISNELIFFGSSSCWSGIPFDTRHSTQCVLEAKMFDLIGFIYCYHFFLFKIFGMGGRRKGFPTLLINRSLPIK